MDHQITVRQVLAVEVFVPIGRLDFDLASDQFVVPGGKSRQCVPPRLERARQSFADELVVRRWEPPYGIFNDRIRQFFDKRRDDRIPGGFIEFGQELAIQVPAGNRQADQIRIGVVKLDRPREGLAHHHHGGPAVVDEGLVAILRDREPATAIAVGEPRPSPLAGMAILVVDEKVHQSRREKGSGIDAVAATLFQVLPQGLRAAHFPGTGKPGGIVRAFGRMFLQRSDQAGEFLAVFPEPGIVRNHHERVLRMEDAGGFHERIDHQRRGWQQRADLVLKNLAHDRVLDFVLQPFGGVLVEGANRVAATRPAR